MAQRPDDLDQWLAALAGDETAQGPRSEAQTLRRVILAEAAQEAAQEPTDPQHEAHALEQLQFRLRRENLLPRRRMPAWPYALAATLAAAAVGLYGLQRAPEPAPERVAYGEAPIWRGAFAQFEVRGGNPRQRAEQLLAALRAEAQQADIYASGPVYTVDAELSAPLSSALVERFAAHGIRVKPGRVRIEFKP